MGYFPNGTSGMIYQERYCFNCANYRDLDDERGPGCAIWDMHLLYNYDDEWKKALEFLIPNTEDKLGCEECTMYVEVK